MNTSDAMQEVVDETDTVVGLTTRTNLWKNGLLHRSVKVWFVTSDGKIIFQKRGKNKKIFPDMWDATVGGGVDPGDDYEKTALKETVEETGIILAPDKLVFLEKKRISFHDAVTGNQSNNFCGIFGSVLTVPLPSLKIETGHGEGFKAFSLEELSALSAEERKSFIPDLLDFDQFGSVYEKLVTLSRDVRA